MSADLAIAVSAQIAMRTRMETTAQNIANINTAGYRGAGVKFEAVLAKAGDTPVAYSSPGATYITLQTGQISHTGNDLDVAIDGDGWFGLNTPDGGLVYTRDGRFHMTDLGELHSVNGYPVVDIGGSPIVIDPSAGPVRISESGTITQAGRQLGALGLFLLPADAKLSRSDNSAVISNKPAEPVEDRTTSSVRQGYLEGSNVNPILEITKLIELSRSFEGAEKAMQNSDDAVKEAIRTLAPG
jgi:flagellar basal-body rod protein FlgF